MPLPRRSLSFFCAICTTIFVALFSLFHPSPLLAAVKLLPPEVGVYHAAHPDFGLRDDLVTKGRVRAFTRLAEKEIVWAYLSFHLDKGFDFPAKQCDILHEMGVVPLVGIMPWSTLVQGQAEPVYTLERILKGYFDDGFRDCAEVVKSLGYPIMIEFGPECNGSWFPWSGAWNGRDEDLYGDAGHPDGPERFRDAYRHVVDIFRDAGAEDVTWVFHIAADGTPKEAWNAASYYYPGDDYVDWIGASVYGRLRGNDPPRPFDAIMKHLYPGMAALSDERPLAILELGVSESRFGDKADWIEQTFESINTGNYPRIRAVAWWNKIYRPDGTRSMLEIDSSPGSLAAYREGVEKLRDKAVF